MNRAIALTATILMFTAISAKADWLESDKEALSDLGFTYGMAEHCGLESAGKTLLIQSALYIGIHTETDSEAEAAGILFREKADEGKAELALQSEAMPCSLVKQFVAGKINRVTSANSKRQKLQ